MSAQHIQISREVRAISMKMHFRLELRLSKKYFFHFLKVKRFHGKKSYYGNSVFTPHSAHFHGTFLGNVFCKHKNYSEYWFSSSYHRTLKIYYCRNYPIPHCKTERTWGETLNKGINTHGTERAYGNHVIFLL